MLGDHLFYETIFYQYLTTGLTVYTLVFIKLMNTGLTSANRVAWFKRATNKYAVAHSLVCIQVIDSLSLCPVLA